MINTDKYKGHTEGPWKMMSNSLPRWSNKNDKHLTRDAPLLLAEVKRLRKAIIEVALDKHESVYEMKQALVEVIE